MFDLDLVPGVEHIRDLLRQRIQFQLAGFTLLLFDRSWLPDVCLLDRHGSLPCYGRLNREEFL